jgi:UDP-N-acetyl-D-galactosamine dehydrogenase
MHFLCGGCATPVDKNNNPDLRPLYGASETVGKVISKGDIVVYESTVYPGVRRKNVFL